MTINVIQQPAKRETLTKELIEDKTLAKGSRPSFKNDMSGNAGKRLIINRINDLIRFKIASIIISTPKKIMF